MNHFSTIPAGREGRIGLFSFGEVPGLTALSTAISVSYVGIDFEDCTTIQSIQYPNLVSIVADGGGYIYVTGCSALASIGFPVLQNTGAGDVDIENCAALTAIRCPALTSTSRFVARNNPLCTEIDLRNLVSTSPQGCSIGTGAVPGDGALTSVRLDSLQSCFNLQIRACASLTSIDLPSLVTTSFALDIQNNPAMTSISIPVFVPENAQQILCDGNALDATTVNHILARCVANAAFVGTVHLQGGTNSAPIGQGLVDKTTLITRGASVVTN